MSYDIGELVLFKFSFLSVIDRISNEGYGVTLTATWILPVALIPGTWHDTDFPKSPTPNSPTPLPQFRPLSFDPLHLPCQQQQ